MITVFISLLLFCIIVGIKCALHNDIIPIPVPKRTYTADDFHIKTIKSTIDYDKDGLDDYTDMMLGARAYINTKPKYKSGYYVGGYPPDGVGVCTDVIWEAFKSAGYSLKDMVDKDIAENPKAYKTIAKADPNIDFRRVKNLKTYFDRHATSLTLDINDVAAWQPGDIVIFEASHIAMVSDKRNKTGRAYIIHNAGHPVETDGLTWNKIAGHYRWKD